ncbi:MAG: RNA 2',3'-cyclic phosphodiesterase [Bacillota bacterium]
MDRLRTERDSLRLFVAIWLPEPLARAAAARLEELRQGSRGIRWVRPEQLHLTLKFLGETPRAELPQLFSALAGVAAATRPFSLSLAPGGVFPPGGPPRVIWLGVTPEEELAVLAARVEEALVPLGHPPEKRPFRAHLTLGRAEPGAIFDRVLLGRALAGGPAVVGRLSLVQSVLRPQGPVYTTLADWSFVGR